MTTEQFSLFHLKLQINPLTGEPSLLAPNFDSPSYSRFKYGDGVIANLYAMQLADELIAKGRVKKEFAYYLSGSAYQYIPTAAISIARDLANILVGRGYQVTYFRILGSAYIGDYSGLSVKEREQLLRKNKLSLDESIKRVKDKALIVVDDIRITGLHEEALKQFLLEQSVESVLFAYVATLDESSGHKAPHAERYLNHTYITCLDRLVNVMFLNDFHPNARTCKLVLSAKADELVSFLNQAPVLKLKHLVSLIESEGYHTVDEYRKNYEMLRSFLDLQIKAQTSLIGTVVA